MTFLFPPPLPKERYRFYGKFPFPSPQPQGLLEELGKESHLAVSCERTAAALRRRGYTVPDNDVEALDACVSAALAAEQSKGFSKTLPMTDSDRLSSKRAREGDATHPVEEEELQEQAQEQASKRRAYKDASWLNFDAFYNENIPSATPEYYAAPQHDCSVTYVSSSDFDARLPRLCARVRARIEEEDCDHVLLWLQTPGKSNFWMTLKCWPYLRHVIDEVWLARGEKRDPYAGAGKRTAHIFLDDALFSGEQMSKILIDSCHIQPLYAEPWLPRAEHVWIMAAMAISAVAKERIRRAHRKRDADAHSSDDDDDDGEEEGEVANSEAEDENFKVVFVREIKLQTVPGDGRCRYYTGFKVPDELSIQLSAMVGSDVIPGLTLQDLTRKPNGIVDVRAPPSPYRGASYVYKGKPLADLSDVF